MSGGCPTSRARAVLDRVKAGDRVRFASWMEPAGVPVWCGAVRDTVSRAHGGVRREVHQPADDGRAGV